MRAFFFGPPIVEPAGPFSRKAVSRPRMPPDSEVGPRQTLGDRQDLVRQGRNGPNSGRPPDNDRNRGATRPTIGVGARRGSRWARGKPLATGRIWFARAVMVQIPEDHQIMIEIVALLGQQSVSEPGAELIQCGVTGGPDAAKADKGPTTYRHGCRTCVLHFRGTATGAWDEYELRTESADRRRYDPHGSRSLQRNIQSA